MQRWGARLFITSYLLVLMFGLGSHLFGYLTYQNLGMYFIVWDMYCGWDAYETRRTLVAEGESGAYYELTPQPWGDFVPYSSAARQDYDFQGEYSGRLAVNVLRQTDHEPMVRVFLIDSVWPKKYNMPESVWQQRYEEPRERVPYYYQRAMFEPDGTHLVLEPDWKQYLNGNALQDNPRLRDEIAASRPYMATSLPTGRNARQGTEDPLIPASYDSAPAGE